MAEQSATRTAAAARAVVQVTWSDLTEADSAMAMADVDEAAAREQYRQSADRVRAK